VTRNMSSGKPVVANSSPLIWLSKIGRLSLLKAVFGGILVPRRVCEETALGTSVDSILISEAVEEGWINVSEENHEEEASVLAGRAGIHLGEAEAIILAHEMDADLIIDEREGSATAEIFGVRPLGTVAVLLLGDAKKQLSFNEFKESLDRLITQGFWLSVDVYNSALEEAQHQSKKEK